MQQGQRPAEDAPRCQREARHLVHAIVIVGDENEPGTRLVGLFDRLSLIVDEHQLVVVRHSPFRLSLWLPVPAAARQAADPSLAGWVSARPCKYRPKAVSFRRAGRKITTADTCSLNGTPVDGAAAHRHWRCRLSLRS